MDRNEDGAIAEREFLAGMVEMFDRIDRDGDGAIGTRRARTSLAPNREFRRGPGFPVVPATSGQITPATIAPGPVEGEGRPRPPPLLSHLKVLTIVRRWPKPALLEPPVITCAGARRSAPS